jgi:CTP:molybdopterin cytidylyltransferase MocA
VIADLPVEVRMNDEWQEGIAATLRHAVGVAMVERAATLVLPCDQYRITPDDLRTLHDTWRLTPSAACVSRWHDYAGPPAILPIECYAEVLGLRGDMGARALLYNPQRPRPLEVPNPRATYDLDSPQDMTIAQSSTALQVCAMCASNSQPVREHPKRSIGVLAQRSAAPCDKLVAAQEISLS